MARSFITKNHNTGFWISDSLMQIVCWGLVNTINKRYFSNNEDWLKNDLREHIYYNSQGYFHGFMHLRLDEFITTNERTTIFNSIIEDTKAFFIEKGETVPVSDLKSFQSVKELTRNWSEPMEVKRLLAILNYLSDVINDRINTTASGPITKF